MASLAETPLHKQVSGSGRASERFYREVRVSLCFWSEDIFASRIILLHSYYSLHASLTYPPQY
jgi:hypothetical protein